MSQTASTSSCPSAYRPGLHWFACFLTLWTFFVICVGGSVKSKEAGLSIPEGFIIHWIKDWWKIPNMRDEYFHRMLVGGLGVMVFGLVARILMVESRPAVKKLAIASAVLIVVQAVFGWMTVTYFAHWQTSIPHAALGQAFLCAIACLAAVTSADWMSETRPLRTAETPTLRRLAVYNAIMLFVQLLLGAAVRHDDQARALREGRGWVFYTHLGAHFLGAMGVVFLQARLLFRVFHTHREQKPIMRPAKLVMMLLGVQLMLGMGAALLKVLYSEDLYIVNDPPMIRVWVATLHVAVGAIMLASTVVLAVRCWRYTSPEFAAAGDVSDNGKLAGVSA